MITDTKVSEIAKEIKESRNDNPFLMTTFYDNFNKKDNTITLIGDITSILVRIADQYQEKEKKIKELREQLKNFDAEAYKDEELAAMQSELARMNEEYYRGFPMSKKEKEGFERWQRSHEEKYHGGYPCYHGASGGGYKFIFVPTSVGTFGSVECSICCRKAFKEAKGDYKKFEELKKEFDSCYDFRDEV